MWKMNKKDKLLKRFYSLPKDFTFDEIVSVFSCYGFHQENKNNPKKASGLMARMQALQEMQRKQQEEMMRKQAELNEKKNNLGK